MKENIFDFYDRTSLKSYNLDESMRYQLNCLGSLDVFTRKHCENVASLVCRLCEYLHCNKYFTEYCTICAYLHDLGKLFIPPSILQKPGRLTDEEYTVMKRHTTIGYDMCMKDLKLRPYAAGTIYHHEALDGSGYPKGLKKENIPYEGQIIRVADEYDAIVSKRQYKTHIGISDTVKIIIENSEPTDKEGDQSLLQKIFSKPKYGKNNKTIVRALIKVVIDDIEYEMTCTYKYLNYLKDNIRRFEEAEKFYKKSQTAKNEAKKEYFENGIKACLLEDENIDNWQNIFSEYKAAYEAKNNIVKNLESEIKIIKKLKV